MAKVYISKSIFPNKALNAFISCVSKHSFKQEFSSAVLREGKACLTLLPSFCAAPSFLFPGEIEAVGTFRMFFCHCPRLLSSVAKERESLAAAVHTGQLQDQKWGLKTPPGRAVITADGLKRQNATKSKRRREVEREAEPGWLLHGWIGD